MFNRSPAKGGARVRLYLRPVVPWPVGIQARQLTAVCHCVRSRLRAFCGAAGRWHLRKGHLRMGARQEWLGRASIPGGLRARV